MNCSETAVTPVGLYPADIESDQTALFVSFTANNDQREAIEKIVRLALPPPNSSLFKSVAEILFEANLIDHETHRAFCDFFNSLRDDGSLGIRARQSSYPLAYAIKRLHEKGAGDPRDRLSSIRTLVSLAGLRLNRDEFAGNMYYKHVIGYRDVCELYWSSGDTVEHNKEYDDPGFTQRLLEFIRECRDSPTISETLRSKLSWTQALLDGSLTLGGARPREGIDGRQQFGIGKRVSPSEELLSILTRPTNVRSALVDDPWVDEDGISVPIEYPKASTTKDRHHIAKHVHSGFGRTNVATEADMAACSIITYTDYLLHADETLNDSELALIWLAAFAGLDVTRPLRLKHSRKHIPQNDEVLLDKADNYLEYNILRRRDRHDASQYETCGLMRLPIASRIANGIDRITSPGAQKEAKCNSNRAASKFSLVNPGLTPTLNRLRASARVHFLRLGFTELEFAAVSGRISPKHLAISHYYPHSALQIARQFINTYEAACERFQLSNLSDLGPSAPRRSKRDTLFCPPSAGLDVVRELFSSIATAYTRLRQELQDNWHVPILKDVIETINLHELSVYVCQELALGLRPTGKIAHVAAVEPVLGCMTADKGSRLFAEQSFSELSDPHWKLLSTSRANRIELARQLRFMGQPIFYDKDLSDLACRCDPYSNRTGVFVGRLTGQFFRQHALQLPGIYEIDRAGNWIRHVATEFIGLAVPRWQADEHFGHRQIGREPLGKWSTAGSSHFEAIRDRVTEMLKSVLPCELLVPINLSART